jgi:hypothetical protein
MKRARRDIRNLHPRRFINAQILWIVCGTGILFKGLPLIAKGWQGETYDLPLGIAYTVIGIVVVVNRFLLVNATLRRLESKLASNPEPSVTERTLQPPPITL